MKKLIYAVLAAGAILATGAWVLFWKYVASKIDDSTFEQVPTLADEHQEWYRGLSEGAWSRFSEPRDPWTLEAPPHQGTLLIMPLLDGEGRLSETGDVFQNALHLPWSIHMPAGVGLIDLSRTQSNLRSMLAYEPDRKTQLLTEKAEERFRKFTAATHVLSGSWTGDEESNALRVEMQLETPEGEWTERFEGKLSEPLFLAAEVTRWVLGTKAFEVEPRVAEFMGKPVGGPAMGNFHEEPFRSLLIDASHPDWPAVIAAHPDIPVLAMLRANVAYRKGDMATAREVELPPLGIDADPWERLTRATWLFAQKEFPRAAHESEILIAQRPENLWSFARFYFDYVPENMRRKSYLESAEKWYARVRPTPMVHAYMGNVHVDVASEYRGTSFYSEVSPVGREMHGKHLKAGGELLSRSLREAGVIPWVVNMYMVALGGGRDALLGLALHRQVVEEFPDNDDTWGTALNYLRPRWSGMQGAGEDLIDELLKHDTKKPEIFWQVWNFHWREAALLEQGAGSLHQRSLAYMKKNPRALAQIEKTIERLFECEPRDKAHAYALTMAADSGEWSLVLKVLRNHPVSYVPLRYYIDEHVRGLAVGRSLFALYWLGEFEVLQQSTQETLEHDAELDARGNVHLSKYIINVDDTRQFLRGLALMMNDQVEEGYELTRSALEEEKSAWWGTILPAHVVHGKVDESTLGRIAKLIEEEPEEQDAYLMKAITLHHLGRSEEARAAWQEGEALEATDMPWLRREAARLLEMPLE